MIAWQSLATSPEATALYALIVAGLEKKFQFIRPLVKWGENHKGIVSAGVAEAETLASEALHAPQLAALELKAKHLESQVQQSEIYKAATAVLHNLDVKVETMTPETKNAVAVAITNEVHNLFGKTVSVSQVLGVVGEFQSLASKVSSSPSVTAANQLSQAASQANTPAQTVPVVDTSTAPSAPTPSAPTPSSPTPSAPAGAVVPPVQGA